MGDSPQVYCVCRSAEVDRFMIGCDHCEEWFHADCISANQKEADKLQKESKYIKKFFCSECREKNPHLTIVYKSKYAEKIKMEAEESRAKEKKKEHKKEKHKEKHRDKDHEKEKKSKDKKSEKRRSRSRSKSKEKVKEKRDQTRPYDKHAHKHKNKDKEKDRDREKDKEREKEKTKEDKKSKVALEDPPIETIDLRKPKAESQEERFKADPVKEEDDIVILDEPKPKKFKGEEYDKEKRIEISQSRRMEELKRERSLSIEMKSPKPKTDVRKVLQPKLENDNVVNLSDSSDEWSPAVGVSRSVTAVKATVKRKASKDQRDKERVKKRRDVESSSDEDEIEIDELAPRQCHGMNCVNCARVGSKYCSDQCGTSLATLRIYQTLPDRIREWNQTPCKSSETNHRELVRIRTEIDSVKKKLEETDKKVVALEAAIARSRSLEASESHSQDSSDEEDEQRGTQVTCVSCGKDVPSKTAIRHMESCFNKFEAQTSYGSMHPTQIEGYQMVCDFYNPDTRTYCKRLRAICPEHTKDKVVGDTDLCGAPLVKNLFKQTGDICKVLKKDCSAHYCWEKLRRAELDLDRVRQWVKLDELMDQERQAKEHLSQRAGVLNLMLHSTFNHELMEKMMAERMQQQQSNRVKQQHQQATTGKK